MENQLIVDACYWLFIALNIADYWITKVILSHETGKEFNPVMRYMHGKFGMPGMALVKLILLVWLGLQLYVGALDVFTIAYLNFMFIVVLGFMYRDAVEAGLKKKMNPIYFYKLQSQES